MDVSVVITTYNHPRWLEKVIWGFQAQTHNHFELLIADDGSDDETRRVISQLTEESGLAIHHVWHENRGFRKCEILNRAIGQSSHDYLVFLDGDCVPRRDFVETHAALASEGRFLSGGIVRLPINISQDLTKQDILKGRATDPSWLRRRGISGSPNLRLLTQNATLGAFLDAVTTTRPTFNGHNASAWKHDLFRVNGFDQRMKYGGLDRELGARLVNAGVRGKQIRHRAACIHLDHSRGYENPQGWEQNNAIRRATQKTGRRRTNHGIAQRPRAA